MANFLFVYRSSTESAPMSSEDMQQMMQRWHEWIKEGMTKGWMIAPGDGLTQEGRVVVGPNQLVTDGPFVEAKEIVGGYSIVQADTLDEAAEYAKGCPAAMGKGSIEVRPLAGFKIES